MSVQTLQAQGAHQEQDRHPQRINLYNFLHQYQRQSRVDSTFSEAFDPRVIKRLLHFQDPTLSIQRSMEA